MMKMMTQNQKSQWRRKGKRDRKTEEEVGSKKKKIDKLSEVKDKKRKRKKVPVIPRV